MDKKTKAELVKEQRDLVNALVHRIDRFRWQAPEFHSQMLWAIFMDLSAHFAKWNAGSEANHVVEILENIDGRCREDRELARLVNAAIRESKNLHFLKAEFNDAS